MNIKKKIIFLSYTGHLQIFSNCHKYPKISDTVIEKKTLCKWAHTLQIHVVPGSTVYINLIQYYSTKDKQNKNLPSSKLNELLAYTFLNSPNIWLVYYFCITLMEK